MRTPEKHLLIVGNNADHAVEHLPARMRAAHREEWIAECNYYADNMVVQSLGCGGAVLLPSYTPEEWRRDLVERVGAIPPIHCSPAPGPCPDSWPFSDDLLAKLAADVDEIRFWGPSAATAKLAAEVAGSQVVSTATTTPEAIRLENKIGFQEVCAELTFDGSVRLPRAEVVNRAGLAGLLPTVARRLDAESVLVKAPGGLGGFGIHRWDRRAPARQAVADLAAAIDYDDVFNTDVLLVQEFVRSAGVDVSLEVDMSRGADVDAEKTRMLVFDHHYLGCVVESEPLTRAERSVADSVVRLLDSGGYRGWLDIDGLSSAEEFVLLEANIRHTGPSTAIALRRYLRDARGEDVTVLQLDDLVVGPCAGSYPRLRRTLDRVERDTGAALVPTQVSSLWSDRPRTAVAFVGRSAGHCADAALSLLARIPEFERSPALRSILAGL